MSWGALIVTYNFELITFIPPKSPKGDFTGVLPLRHCER